MLISPGSPVGQMLVAQCTAGRCTVLLLLGRVTAIIASVTTATAW